MTPDSLLTLAEAARLVDRSRDWLYALIKSGKLASPVRDGVRVVAVSDLIRLGLLDGGGEPPRLPEKLGLPLLVPLDPEQMLTKREVSELLGATLTIVSQWVFHGRIASTLVRGWPASGPGPRSRRLICVGELVREGLLAADGTSAWVPSAKRSGVARQRRPVLPARQRSIPDDLPTDLRDPRIGIEDPESAALVLAGLSRFLACDGSRNGTGAYRALRLLRLYAHTEVTRAGATHPAPCPDVDPALPIPTGATVATNLGLPERYRQDEWRRLVDADPVVASFDVNYVARYVPPPLWGVFLALVVDGPALANDRLRRIVYSESQRPLEGCWAQRDPSATQTESSVRGAVGTFRRFFKRVLVPMYQDGYPSALLDAWTWVPAYPKIEASSWKADGSAPRRTLIRLAWQQLDHDVKTRLAGAMRSYKNPRPPGDIDDVDALLIARQLPLYRLENAALFRASRNRALLAVYTVLGARREAVMDLDRGDYVPDFRCPDGDLSAAIALRPGKHRPRDEISWKPIPTELTYVVDLYLLIVERLLGAPLPPDGPLFIPSLTNAGLHMTGAAFREVIGGAGNPLLPKPTLPMAGSGEDASEARRPGRGYSVQSLRRAALQHVRHGARTYCAENDMEADPDTLAEVLLDHKKLRGDTMGYADVNTVQGRIRWSQVAITIGWEMLTTERGARRVPDVRRFRELLELQTALESELRTAEQETERLFAARYTAVSQELVVELMVATHRARAIKRSLAEVKATIVAMERGHEGWLILPDDAPDQRKVDLKAVRRGGSGVARRVQPDRVRWFLTIMEWAEFAGSPATARRWAAGKLPFAGGDPRNPWQPGDGAVDDSLGARRRRIDVDKINPRYFDTAAKRARRDEILATMPRGFSRQECARPSPSRPREPADAEINV